MAPGSIVSLLFTDLVGSTELGQRLGEDAAEEFRHVHFGILRAAVQDRGGREVKNLGDGIMAVFGSALDALGGAVAIQQAVRAHNLTGTGPTFAVRVGVHAGEPIEEAGDYFGTPVVVAKRLCDRADADQILISETLANLVGTRGGFRVRPLGTLDLEGLTDPVPSAEVIWGGSLATPQARRRVVRPPALVPPPDAFIGREAGLERAARLLDQARLVTLIGPGGVGKTRLSGHLVDAVADRYPDGVWCCALASVLSDDAVPDAVATALKVERRTGVTLTERIVEFLATKRALLVLDNCEQIIDGAADLAAAVLAGTPTVDVLATSREPLAVPGEQRCALAPLLLPDGRPGGGEPALARPWRSFWSARRPPGAASRWRRSTFRPSMSSCRRVDGLPLALELAAAQVTGHTVPEILADVTDRLADLSVRRGRPERHRSIHALVEWSYDLLDDTDRRLFERMAVFAGGCDAAAVSAISADGGRVVGRLVDQSLVATRSDGTTTRYALLEPVRAYAEQRLLLRADNSAARDAHARHFLALAEVADAGLRGSNENSWRTRLEEELSNLRAAYAWLMHRQDADGALRLVAALFWFALGSGVSEVYAWAEAAAERFAATDEPGLPQAFASAAMGALLRGDIDRGADLAARGIAAAAAEPVLARFALYLAGSAQLFRGKFEPAAELYHDSGELSAAAADAPMRVFALGCEAMALAYGGRTTDARRVGDLGLELATLSGNSTLLAWAYFCSGEIRMADSPAEAAALLRRSLAEAGRIQHRFILGVAGLSEATVEARHGDPVAALSRFPDLLEHWQRSGAWTQQWITVRNLIQTLARAGHSEPAAVLYGALRDGTAAPPVTGEDATRLDAALEQLRTDLGDDALARHRGRGAGLSNTGAVAYALDTLRRIRDAEPAQGPAEPGAPAAIR